MSTEPDKPTKMTLELTPGERTTLDELRRARGDRSAAATIRALIREDARRLPLRLRDGATPDLATTPSAEIAEAYRNHRGTETGSSKIHDTDRPTSSEGSTRAAQLEAIAACHLRAHHGRLSGRSCPSGCGA